MAIINITYTDQDITDMATEAGVPLDEAKRRVDEWAKHITSTVTDLISEQLYTVIKNGQP